MMKTNVIWTAAAGLLLCAGCAHERSTGAGTMPPQAAAPAAPGPGGHRIVTPADALSGKVTWVNPNLRFVVITFPIGQMPTQDRRLEVYRGDLKVGEVRMTGPQQDDSMVGDIVAGEAGVGDVVRDR
jgi:hypothetical protein